MSRLSMHSVRKLLPYLIVLGFLFVVFQTSFSPILASKARTIVSPYCQIVLKNGLGVIVKEVHSSPIVAIDIRVATGAKNDPPEEAGISHFFEHMLFKGTSHWKVGEIAKVIKSVGGNLNAETSIDATHYYVVVPSEYVDLALNVEADAIINSTFDPTEIERERKVILEEICMRKNDLQSDLDEQMMRKVFAGTLYANVLAGSDDTLKNINRDSFLKYYQKYYRPNNMVITVVGDVNTTKVQNQIQMLFKDFEFKKIPHTAAIAIPKIKGITRVEITKEVGQSYLCFGFPIPKLNPKDDAAMDVLKVIVGNCRSSRLKVLQGTKKLVKSISAEYDTYHDAGLFTIKANTQSASVTTIENEIRTILRQINRTGVSNGELEKAKAILKTRFVFSGEDDNFLANLMSAAAVDGSIEDVVIYENSISKVTKKDIKRVVRYLNPDSFVLLAITPKEVK